MMPESDIFRRAPDAPSKEERRASAAAGRRAKEWIAATDRLCQNSDFAAWLYGVMDDLGLFDRQETTVDAFGQGFMAAASRIRNRMLEAPRAVNLFADFAKRHHGDLHRRLVADRKNNQKTEK